MLSDNLRRKLRLIAALSVVGVIVTLAVPLVAAADSLYPLTFPVDGPHHYTDTFGAPRSGGRTHTGTDIMADKMTPIVAAASGTVGWMHDERGGNCCAMALYHDDGWASWYIHMNNDTPGTDDGQGWGFAPGITSGVHVSAGQLIGWVGDSGNAENTASHLHFELHEPSGTPIDAYPALYAADTGSPPPSATTTTRPPATTTTYPSATTTTHPPTTTTTYPPATTTTHPPATTTTTTTTTTMVAVSASRMTAGFPKSPMVFALSPVRRLVWAQPVTLTLTTPRSTTGPPPSRTRVLRWERI